MTIALSTLLEGFASIPRNDVQIEDLTLDSREVRPGCLFLALPGRRAHGLEFAAEAAARGASAILFEPTPEAAALELPDGVFAAPVAGLTQRVGMLADRFFERPSAALRVIGITGTNGKTTSAYLLAQCLDRLGVPAGYIGTLGWGRLGALEEPTHTTPDAVRLQRMLAHLRRLGVRVVALEVSSHALDQGRVEGVRFHAAAFTNLSRDHLDYHASMQAYGEAKARLFARTGLERAVINVGDAFGQELARRCVGRRTPVIAVWMRPESVSERVCAETEIDAGASIESLHAAEVKPGLEGLALEVRGSLGAASIATRLLGRFNAENALLVLGCLQTLEVPLAEGARALAACRAPPGRMELIEAAAPGKPRAVIDYAHSPDALAKALATLREHCRGALWCVFGCGGDRDRGKRPLMGAIADELADRVIVTDDNPRSEPPERIAREIVAGFRVHEPRIIHDRGHAIEIVLAEAAANDWVLIAGKGHEDYQIYGTTRRRFSDRQAALSSLGVAA